MASYTEVVGHLRNGGLDVRELEGAGRVAVVPEAGRVAALAFDDGPTLVWSHPALDTVDERGSAGLVGGIGGDRLWFAPELAYFWSGAPDWKEFANNATQPGLDPAGYAFVDAGDDVIALHADIHLRATDGGPDLRFGVDREIRLVSPPVKVDGVDDAGVETVGIETRHRVVLHGPVPEGRLGLWHLLQLPPGATLVVPLRADATEEQKTPLSYANPGDWVRLEDQVRWRYSGLANAKLGLSSAAVTGRSAVLNPLEDGRWSLIVRDFPVDRSAVYADYLYGDDRRDQILQAWDGFGFGEMEFHGPAISGDAGHEHVESDRLWVVAGPADRIVGIARDLLGVDVSDVVAGA